MRNRIAGLVLLSLVAAGSQAWAEAYLDLYAGPSFTDSSRVEIKSDAAVTDREVSFSQNTTYGLRSGYWFSGAPWVGVGGDVNFMRAKGDKAKFDLFCLTPMAMFRLPLLKSEEIPQGVLQPYAGLGPSLAVYTYASADLGPPTNNINGSNASLGLQIPAGMALQLSKHVALFAEYRFDWYKVVIMESNHTIFGTNHDVANKLTAALDIHNALFGVSFRF